MSKLEAAQLVGVSERTFRRWCPRFEAEGEAGLHDRRLGLASAKRVRRMRRCPAYSPEARGRCERAFRTLQHRLPKELDLAGIIDVEAANRFLRDVYLPAHNARFAVAAERQ